jgi:hypothetical protein
MRAKGCVVVILTTFVRAEKLVTSSPGSSGLGMAISIIDKRSA